MKKTLGNNKKSDGELAGSKVMIRSVILFFTLFLLIVTSSTFVALNKIEKETKENTEESLVTILNTTHEALVIWIEHNLDQLENYVSDTVFVHLTEELLKTSADKSNMTYDIALKNLRNYLTKNSDEIISTRFYIVDPDFINIGSNHDRHLGDTNLIYRKRKPFLAKVLQGYSMYIPPVLSEATLDKSTKEKLPVMFYAAPVKNSNEEIIAALIIQEDPTKQFSRLCGLGRFGTAGETYAFDENGKLLSESRFKEELKEMGLLKEDSLSTLSIDIRNPGINLKKAYETDIPRKKQELTLMAKQAINGINGTNLIGYPDYRGVPVFGAWLWDDNYGFGLTTEIDVNEAMSSFFKTRLTILIILGIVVLLTIGGILIIVIISSRNNKALGKLNEELEEKVIKRTNQLEKANSDLIKSESLAIENAERSNLLLESASDGIFGVDAKGQTTFINSSALNQLGYKSKEIIGKSIHNLIHHHHKDGSPYSVANCPMEKAYSEGKRSRVDNEVLWCKDGTMFHVEYSATPMKKDGELIGAVIMFRDISEKRKIEQKIRKSEEQFRTLVSNIPGVVYRCYASDPWQMLFISDEIEKLSGYPASDYTGEKPLRNYAEIIHPDDRITVSENVQAAIKNGHPHINEYRVIDSKKEIHWVYARGQATYDDEGKALYIDGTIMDITERKLAEQKAEILSRDFTNFLESTSDLVYLKDKNLRYMACSKPLSIMLGYDNWNDIVGKTEEEVQKKESIIRFNKEPELSVIEKGKVIELTEDIIQHGDKKGWASTVKKPLKDSEGNIVGILSISRDITEIIEMTRELENAKEEAIAATEAKSRFLANMSHEIRTPMNAIIGLSHLALQTDLNTKQYDYVNKIQSSGKTLLGIINDILDFSKIEAGKLDIENIEFDLEHVFSEVANVITYKAHEKGLELVFKIDNDVPLSLIGDPLRIEQILMNLANNAIKFTTEGEILISAEVDKEVNDNVWLKFSVIDSGVGITKEQMGKLFHDFAQADSSTTRKYGGTGLGLTISKRLTELMDGRIWVESEYGEGSRFNFTIKLKKLKEQKKAKLVPAIDLRGMKVLVCDDNQTSLDVLSGMLTALTFEVKSVRSGKEALHELEKNSKNPYNLVLMDWKMPGLDGLQVVEKIKASSKIAKVPTILMLSAYTRDELIQKVDELEINGLLTKPVSHSTLFNNIMQAFKKNVEPGKKQIAGKTKYEKELQKIKGARILLVEDNDINQQVASEMLESAGFVVEIAIHGKEAIEKVTGKTKFDLVFMDLQMPIMDGIAATKEIRKNIPADELAIVAMTADVIGEIIEETKRAGMNGFVPKPIDPEELIEATIRWIEPGERDIVEVKTGETSLAAESIEIPDLKSIDIKDGLNRVNNNKKLYQNLLFKFHDNNINLIEQLKKYFYQGNEDTALRMVHTVKGVSGNIGAIDLHLATKELERKLKEKDYDDINALLEEYSFSLKPVLKVIEEYKNTLKPVKESHENQLDQSELDKEKFKKLLQELKDLLEDNDMDASSKIEELNQLPGLDKYRKQVEKIESALKNYNFEEAKMIVMNIKP